jgi:hypothetical protein
VTQLSLDQLARRAANRRNNRLRKELPLFAALMTADGPMVNWLTSPTEQKERIERQHNEARKMVERWEIFESEFKRRGDKRRAIVAQHVDPETLAALDAYYQKTCGHLGPQYWADYWWGKEVEFAPERAQANCPNGHMHKGFSSWHRNCPTCGVPLPAHLVTAEEAAKTGQLTLLEIIPK